MIMTQGFSGGHQANDYDGGHGSPIYAIKPGVIKYYCDYWPNIAPGYGAIVFHDDGTRSLYWHLQQNAGSPPCEQLNLNY